MSRARALGPDACRQAGPDSVPATAGAPDRGAFRARARDPVQDFPRAWHMDPDAGPDRRAGLLGQLHQDDPRDQHPADPRAGPFPELRAAEPEAPVRGRGCRWPSRAIRASAPRPASAARSGRWYRRGQSRRASGRWPPRGPPGWAPSSSSVPPAPGSAMLRPGVRGDDRWSPARAASPAGRCCPSRWARPPRRRGPSGWASRRASPAPPAVPASAR